jgi:hypothetical protein
MYELFKNELKFLASVGYFCLCELAIDEALREGRIKPEEAKELRTVIESVR